MGNPASEAIDYSKQQGLCTYIYICIYIYYICIYICSAGYPLI